MLFGICSWSEVYFTNALKCQTNQRPVKKLQHTVPCVTKWLQHEIEILFDVLPVRVPVVIAGSKALEGMLFLYPELRSQLGDRPSLRSCRRNKTLRLQGHPVAVTYNPASVCKLEMRDITEMIFVKGQKTVRSTKGWPTLPLLCPYSLMIKDLLWLEEYIDVDSDSK